jgi:hypothetical protein
MDALRRLLLAGANEVYDLKLSSHCASAELFFNAHSFAYLVEQCQNLKR